METQKRDTVLYFCPSDPSKKKFVVDELLYSEIDLENLTPEEIGKLTGEAIVEGVSTFFFSPDSEEEENSKNNLKPAVIICPGGSYHHLGMPIEGFTTARWFQSIGVHAFVLRYRVAYNCHHYPDQLEDIQMAIHYVRLHAEEFGVDKNKIGAIGFSAGGHLVTMSAEFSARDEISKLGIKLSESLRPDFVMPIYPVVSMQDDIAHKWSRRSLLGHQWSKPSANKGWRPWNFWGHAYSQALKDEFSMENPANIPDDMPPVFILACEDDPIVMYENSVRLDKALTERGVNHLFVTYPKGGHGFGMNGYSSILKETHWNNRNLLPWLINIGVLSDNSSK